MSRTEKRRMFRNEQKKTPTYHFTQEQLDALIQKTIRDDIDKIKREAMEEAVNTAMTLMLVLPMEVMMDHFWQDDYVEKVPQFAEHVLDYYYRWQKGEIDIEKLEDDLWTYGGVRLYEERLDK